MEIIRIPATCVHDPLLPRPEMRSQILNPSLTPEEEFLNCVGVLEPVNPAIVSCGLQDGIFKSMLVVKVVYIVFAVHGYGLLWPIPSPFTCTEATAIGMKQP